MAEFIKRVLTSLALGSIFWISFIYLPSIYFSLILLGILGVMIMFECCKIIPSGRFSFWLFIFLYPILPFALLIYMNQHPLYHDLLLELFLLVASYDTGSYIVGSLIGRHKIVPHISPQKTWEGAFGGFVFAVIGLSLLVLYEQGKILSWWFILGFTFIICVLAFLGDLFESWLKRRAHIKHSGTWLPGHGGFLDRFDGIMFAVFFFFLFRESLRLLFG